MEGYVRTKNTKLTSIFNLFLWYIERRVSASSVPLDPRIKELTEENEQFRKKNNLLTLKVELLLDMLAQKTAEADMLTNDVEKLRQVLLKTSAVGQKSAA